MLAEMFWLAGVQMPPASSMNRRSDPDPSGLSFKASRLRLSVGLPASRASQDRSAPVKASPLLPVPEVKEPRPAARALALAGIGFVYLFEPLARADIEAGRLVQVLPEASIEEPGLFLYFPRRASMAPKLRAFIDT